MVASWSFRGAMGSLAKIQTLVFYSAELKGAGRPIMVGLGLVFLGTYCMVKVTWMLSSSSANN